LLLLALCAACDEPALVTTTGSASATVSAASAQPPVVIVYEGKQVVQLSAAQIDGKLPLGPLLPEKARDVSSWRSLSAVSADGKRKLELRRFAETYGDLDVMLFQHPEHGPSIGLFPRATDRDLPPHVKKKLLEPRQKLIGVARIDVRTSEQPAVTRELAKLEVSLDGVDRALLDALTKLESVTPPELTDPDARGRGRRRKRAGWPLSAVIALLTPPTGIVAITAHGEDGPLTLEAPWDDPKRVILLRHTNRGRLELALWSADQSDPVQRVRGLKRIELLRSKPQK
jgi:hypothetical protein